MGMTIEVEEKMISEAEFGLYNLYYKITKKKADELRKQGFVVTDSKESRNFPRLHKIDWSKACIGKFDYEDVSKLNENSDEYTFPQKLYIISYKNDALRKKKNKK